MSYQVIDTDGTTETRPGRIPYGIDDEVDADREKRRANYLKRHANEDWTDETTAGFWARWLLWNKPTIAASIRDATRRFGLDVRLVRSTT